MCHLAGRSCRLTRFAAVAADRTPSSMASASRTTPAAASAAASGTGARLPRRGSQATTADQTASPSHEACQWWERCVEGREECHSLRPLCLGYVRRFLRPCWAWIAVMHNTHLHSMQVAEVCEHTVLHLGRPRFQQWLTCHLNTTGTHDIKDKNSGRAHRFHALPETQVRARLNACRQGCLWQHIDSSSIASLDHCGQLPIYSHT